MRGGVGLRHRVIRRVGGLEGPFHQGGWRVQVIRRVGGLEEEYRQLC